MGSAKNSRMTLRRLLLVVLLITLTGACAPRVKLDRAVPLDIDPAGRQLLALIPFAATRGYPQSGALLSGAVEQVLLEKKYRLIEAVRVTRTLAELSSSADRADTAFLKSLGEQTGAGLILEGTILNFRSEKSYLGSGSVPVRDPQRAFQDTWVLPTYRFGGCEMRLVLRLFDPRKDAFIWAAEGHASGPAGEEASLARALAETLLEAFPSLRPPPGNP